MDSFELTYSLTTNIYMISSIHVYRLVFILIILLMRIKLHHILTFSNFRSVRGEVACCFSLGGCTLSSDTISILQIYKRFCLPSFGGHLVSWVSVALSKHPAALIPPLAGSPINWLGSLQHTIKTWYIIKQRWLGLMQYIYSILSTAYNKPNHFRECLNQSLRAFIFIPFHQS